MGIEEYGKRKCWRIEEEDIEGVGKGNIGGLKRGAILKRKAIDIRLLVKCEKGRSKNYLNSLLF